MPKVRTLASGRIITIHNNCGLRKRCRCARRAWATCSHPWHFSFKWAGVHHRFAIDKYATAPIVTKANAQNEADRLRREIRAGHFPPVAPAAPTAPEALTFEKFTEKWRDSTARAHVTDNQRLNDAGITHRLGKVELEPGRLLKDESIGLLTTDTWESVFAQLTRLAASSSNKYRQAVMSLQDWGIDKGYLTRPWLSAKSLKKGGPLARRKGARRDRRLVPDTVDGDGKVIQQGEERRLLHQSQPWLQRLIIAALESCCRRGELLSLQWRDVDLARGLLTVRAENAKSRTMRQLPISPRFLAILQLVKHDPAGKLHKPTAYVFGNDVGEKIADPKKSWAKACQAAGIDDLRLHDLRHEAGSRLLEAGWPLHHVQMMLGHQDAKTTSIYLNVTTSQLVDSMQRFGSQPLHSLAHMPNTELPPRCNDHKESSQNMLVN